MGVVDIKPIDRLQRLFRATEIVDRASVHDELDLIKIIIWSTPFGTFDVE